MPELRVPPRVGVWSPGIRRIPHLGAFLDDAQLRFRPPRWRRVDAWVGWGTKPNTARPRTRAEAEGVPYFALEDGFLRSIEPGRDAPLAIVVDDLGIYYDATRPSRLERWLAEGEFGAEELDRARRLRASLRATGLSKYNHQPDVDLGPKPSERVLIVDQTAGDQSLRLGMCSASFEELLDAALTEHPDAEVLVKTHPDVIAGAKSGHLARSSSRVRVLSAPAHPASLLAQVDHVYAMTSQMGFEALLHEVPVTCFGVPWYAGWGLTDDRARVPARRARRRSLDELIAAAYLRYPRYVDPETGRRCDAERVVEHLEENRRCGESTRGTIVAVGFSSWKRGFLPAFLSGPGTRIRFARNAEAAVSRATEDAKLVAWGTRGEGALGALADRRGLPLWRMEDGFLRSVGLGSDLYAPASLVLDSRGLYYDPATPSDLEVLLREADFSEHELARAVRLRERIIGERLSKYNVGSRRRVAIAAGDRRVALVIGQVEDDASIQRGCLDIRRNEELLREARRARPDAYLVFKPHPDVVSGNRRGEVPTAVAEQLADEVVRDVALADCLDAADEVHTMTSLVGFEALLREREVWVYGQPFYSGWGLTRDRHPHPRRQRERTLDELVAATLIRYPRYVSRVTGRYTTPEVVIDQLAAARARSTPGSLRRSWAARQLRKGRNLARYGLTSLLHALHEVRHGR